MISRSDKRNASRTALLLAGTLLLAACSAAATPTAPPGAATLATRATALGAVLTDAQGRTLYLFEKDQKDESYCKDACAAIWPPMPASGQPTVTGNADAKELGSIKREDGTTQLSYGGHPLYYYVADNSRPGSLTGQDAQQFGAGWYVLSPKGDKIEAPTTKGTSNSSGGGQGGYGS